MKRVYTLDVTTGAIELLLEILDKQDSKNKRLRSKLHKVHKEIHAASEPENKIEYIIEPMEFTEGEWLKMANAVLSQCTIQLDGEPFSHGSPQTELFIAIMDTTYGSEGFSI